MKNRVIIYGRCSTDLQSYLYQVNSLKEYAKKMNYDLVQIFTEKISGLKKSDERKALQELLEFIKINNVNKILVTEVSRISRKSSVLHEVVESITKQGVSIYFQNYNFETLDQDENGRVIRKNLFADILISLIGTFAQYELESLKNRIAMGKANSNKPLGRKKGYRKPENVFLQENYDVIKYLEKKYTIREVAKITEKSLGLVQKVKHALAA